MYGGAIYLENSEKKSYISSSSFTNNTCKHKGGALMLIKTHLTISSCAFKLNSAKYEGGAIFF